MPRAVYEVEVIHEGTGEYMNFTYEYDLEPGEDAEFPINIFDEILSDLSIVPQLSYLEDDDE